MHILLLSIASVWYGMVYFRYGLVFWGYFEAVVGYVLRSLVNCFLLFAWGICVSHLAVSFIVCLWEFLVLNFSPYSGLLLFLVRSALYYLLYSI